MKVTPVGNACFCIGASETAPNQCFFRYLFESCASLQMLGPWFQGSKIVTNNGEITTDGCWNVLVVDDLFDSGASMDAACAVLRKYLKVGKIYVAALTWK
ncbi:hypothetical protein [Pseudomonas protegens]